jgi:hypothetical protein
MVVFDFPAVAVGCYYYHDSEQPYFKTYTAIHTTTAAGGVVLLC